MRYNGIEKARFLSRPNRFIAVCESAVGRVRAHVKNTGRCRELLVPGASVYLQRAASPQRKTGYSLICVERDGTLFNLDSQAPNQVFGEALECGVIRLPGIGAPQRIVPEVRYHDSRLDFYIEGTTASAFVEVKGVTLLENGIARFPDAPTERGIKHLEHLCRAAKEGIRAFVVFVLAFSGARAFAPNWRTHRAFGEALVRAREEGVGVLAWDCRVRKDEISIRAPVRVLYF